MEKRKKARVIAYYLPQYHPIPENDKYWGKGFTEWTNVTKAKPLFKGHYQPKLPADLGFYDLRLPIIREQQVALAEYAGIEGFMYWHYWFEPGKMVLEKPFEDVLHSGRPDFPFCLGWANHSWTTKTWTKEGSVFKNEVIFEQKYLGEDDFRAHFDYCKKAFEDKRYIRFKDCPIFVIYAPKDIPNVKDFLLLWRALAKQNGFKDIHFVALRYGSEATVDELLELGFDAVNSTNQYEAENRSFLSATLFKKIRGFFTRLTRGVVLRKYDYKKIIKNWKSLSDKRADVYPTIISGYDRTARAGRMATIYYNYTPELFEEHVRDVIESVKDKSEDEKIVFLKSWNEWAEGNYVEPDQKYGKAFLDVLRKILIDKE